MTSMNKYCHIEIFNNSKCTICGLPIEMWLKIRMCEVCNHEVDGFCSHEYHYGCVICEINKSKQDIKLGRIKSTC